VPDTRQFALICHDKANDLRSSNILLFCNKALVNAYILNFVTIIKIVTWGFTEICNDYFNKSHEIMNISGEVGCGVCIDDVSVCLSGTGIT